jgi:hypothetical protein
MINVFEKMAAIVFGVTGAKVTEALMVKSITAFCKLTFCKCLQTSEDEWNL